MENVLSSILKWKQKSKWKSLVIWSWKGNDMIKDKIIDQNTKNNHANIIKLNQMKTEQNKMYLYRLTKISRKA